MYELRCPKCGYHYYLEDEVITDDYMELCPICGYKSNIRIFILRQLR